MDFRQTVQPNGGRPSTPSPVPTSAGHKEDKHTAKYPASSKWVRIFSFVLLVSVAILVLAMSLALAHGSKDNEFKYVDGSKYQAVFLNNGQVYFGHIDGLNSSYVRMTGIYYLTQGSDSSSNYSLVKLGCQQIHDPYDAMLINRSQVTFWENLQDNGKVVSSIKQAKAQNGPDCSQVSNQTQASGTSTQGSSTTPTPTTNSTPTTTK